ncbi:MAG: M28 family metallopeptidase [Longimicrobiales bacterium]
MTIIRMDRKACGAAALLALLAACAGVAEQQVQESAPDRALSDAAATITPVDMYARIAFLASDALAGRDTPSPGLEAAAAYLASEFRALGLEPAGDSGTFIQRYPYPPPRLGRAGSEQPQRSVGDVARAPNVVALLRGADAALRDSYIVFSAHMDHLGIGAPDATGDSIYNGADDDASGTAALVEIAEAFAAMPQRPARSIVFLAVSGEEDGLLGSLWFSENPTVPLDGIVANINIDMIGRNAPDSVVVIGQEYSTLGPLVQRIAGDRSGELELVVAADPWPEERFFFRSDHFSFARKEIPALFFFAGVHEDYHRPSDEVDEIDPDKAARIGRLIFYTAYELANAAEPPRWTPEGLREIRALSR